MESDCFRRVSDLASDVRVQVVHSYHNLRSFSQPPPLSGGTAAVSSFASAATMLLYYGFIPQSTAACMYFVLPLVFCTIYSVGVNRSFDP